MFVVLPLVPQSSAPHHTTTPSDSHRCSCHGYALVHWPGRLNARPQFNFISGSFRLRKPQKFCKIAVYICKVCLRFDMPVIYGLN